MTLSTRAQAQVDAKAYALAGRNRITEHAATVRALIAKGGKDGALDTPAKVAAFERLNALTFDEHFAYQNAQSRAFATGLLTLDEAQTCYAALGEVMSTHNGGWSKGTDLALKVSITMLMGQLI